MKLGPEVYECDPKKNKLCRKTLCQKECFMTTNKAAAKNDKVVYKFNKETGKYEEADK